MPGQRNGELKTTIIANDKGKVAGRDVKDYSVGAEGENSPAQGGYKCKNTIKGLNEKRMKELINAATDSICNDLGEKTDDIKALISEFVESTFQKEMLTLQDQAGRIQVSIELLNQQISDQVDQILADNSEQQKEIVDRISTELIAQKENLRAYIEEKNSELYVQVAQLGIEINSIESYIKEVLSKQEQVQDAVEGVVQTTQKVEEATQMTWEEVRNVALVTRSTHDLVKEQKQKLKTLLESDAEKTVKINQIEGTLDLLLSKLDEMTLKGKIGDVEAEKHYLRESILGQTKEIQTLIQKRGENFETGIKAIENHIENVTTHEFDELKKKADEQTTLLQYVAQALGIGHQGYNCHFCGSSNSRRLRCVICGSRNILQKKEVSFELSDDKNNPLNVRSMERKGDMVTVAPNGDDGVLDLATLCQTTGSFEGVRKLLIANTVRKIKLEGLSNARKSFLTGENGIFPDLERISLQIPKDGEGYELGRELLAGCFEGGKDIELFGMEFVTKIGDGCFGNVPEARDKESDFMIEKGFEKVSYDARYFLRPQS